MKRKRLLIVLSMILTLTVSGCGNPGLDNNTGDSESSVDRLAGQGIGVSTTINPSEIFSNRDFEVGYDESESVMIQLNGDSVVCNSDAVQISGSTVTIVEEGTYILSGTLNDGMVIVNTDKKDKTQLVLDDVNIHSETSAPIYVLQADKVFITMAAGSTNTLSNGGTYTAIDDNNIDSVIFSKEDITLNGSGTMIVTSPAGHGIVSKDSLRITGGTYDINCASHAVAGKDDVCIVNADFTMVSGKDGIQAENEEDDALGFVYIQSGTFSIDAQGDGISASSYVLIEDGSFEITSGGGSANGSSHSSNEWGNFRGGGNHPGGAMDDGRKDFESEKPEEPMGVDRDDAMTDVPDGRPDEWEEIDGNGQQGPMGGGGKGFAGGKPGGFMGGDRDGEADEHADYKPYGPMGEMSEETSDSTLEGTSMKGIKATTNLTIQGGIFTINSADDAFHSNSSVTIQGGTFEIATGDDAFHADETLTITDGAINITESYEGLEGLHVEISGGDISLVAGDDGLNAAGGKDASGAGGRDGMFHFGMSQAASDGSIKISGGTVKITASGDGLDANGSLDISGGYIEVCGPNQGDTATLDYDTSGTVSGGTFIGTGASSMAQSISDSKQGVIALRVSNQVEGTVIEVTDKEGNVLITHTPDLAFSVFIYSSPELVKGETYTISVGSSSVEYTVK